MAGNGVPAPPFTRPRRNRRGYAEGIFNTEIAKRAEIGNRRLPISGGGFGVSLEFGPLAFGIFPRHLFGSLLFP